MVFVPKRRQKQAGSADATLRKAPRSSRDKVMSSDGDDAAEILWGIVSLCCRIAHESVHCAPSPSSRTQCKRPCIVSLRAHARFTYVFGDLGPEDDAYVEALFELVSKYGMTVEGFLDRKDRPEELRANILGRLPPLGRQSHLVSNIEVVAT